MHINDFPDQIHLKTMSFYGYTGVFYFEKQNGQNFLIDLALCFAYLAAVETDRIEDTVNYGDAFMVVKNIVEREKFDLIERLAGEIAGRILAQFLSVDAVEVVVSKPDAPVEGDFETMRVRIFRDRSFIRKGEAGQA